MIKIVIPVLVASTITIIVSIVMLVRNYTLSELVSQCKKLSTSLYTKLKQMSIRYKIPELLSSAEPKVTKAFQKIPWTKISSKIKHIINLTKLAEIFNNLSYGDWVGRFRPRFLKKTETQESSETSAEKNPDTLKCRVQVKKKKVDSDIETFKVEICGSIQTPNEHSKNKTANLKISILDITDGIKNVQPVIARNKQCSTDGQMQQSEFFHLTSLGKLLHQVTTISDWTTVAQIPFEKLFLARKGQRKLQFDISVFTECNNSELAKANGIIEYENTFPGYLDLKENIERTKTLTVALAFSVGAADEKLKDREIELIKKWSLNNLFEYSKRNSERDKRKIFKALDKTATFFRKGNHLNVEKICSEIAQISPIGQRYDIFQLCLKVARAKETINTEVLTLLKDMADWLELDNDKFRLMMQKFLPVNMHKDMDIETVLGITSEMNKEIARKKLNREYSKWNSRVTNSDPVIQTQADQMLKLIAEVRNQYITK